ncbi:hypothetical protein BV20DRAFT_973809 [Pilatotrama ljubarskyi]|nr:hypothetical protein BV20DRAFT_973809 [Pilatotrama ljubarskyi]
MPISQCGWQIDDALPTHHSRVHIHSNASAALFCSTLCEMLKSVSHSEPRCGICARELLVSERDERFSAMRELSRTPIIDCVRSTSMTAMGSICSRSRSVCLTGPRCRIPGGTVLFYICSVRMLRLFLLRACRARPCVLCMPSRKATLPTTTLLIRPDGPANSPSSAHASTSDLQTTSSQLSALPPRLLGRFGPPWAGGGGQWGTWTGPGDWPTGPPTGAPLVASARGSPSLSSKTVVAQTSIHAATLPQSGSASASTSVASHTSGNTSTWSGDSATMSSPSSSSHGSSASASHPSEVDPSSTAPPSPTIHADAGNSSARHQSTPILAIVLPIVACVACAGAALYFWTRRRRRLHVQSYPYVSREPEESRSPSNDETSMAEVSAPTHSSTRLVPTHGSVTTSETVSDDERSTSLFLSSQGATDGDAPENVRQVDGRDVTAMRGDGSKRQEAERPHEHRAVLAAVRSPATFPGTEEPPPYIPSASVIPYAPPSTSDAHGRHAEPEATEREQVVQLTVPWSLGQQVLAMMARTPRRQTGDGSENSGDLDSPPAYEPGIRSSSRGP